MQHKTSFPHSIQNLRTKFETEAFIFNMKQASQLRYLLATLMLIEKMDIEKPKREEKKEIE